MKKNYITLVIMLLIMPYTNLHAETGFGGVEQLFNPAFSPVQNSMGNKNQATNRTEQPKSEEIVPDVDISSPQRKDYIKNSESNVFGANLFTGAFARKGATQFNPNYAIAVGDKIHARFWGAYEYDSLITVDPKGNIYLPHVGPVKVLGVRNKDLQKVVLSEVSKVFRANVNSYASLATAQPVRVFVSGFVNRPGLYSGTSMDSILHYLDQAGGIDTERGSFLNVQIKRGKKIRSTANLYDFLFKGIIPLVQLSDGDVIFVTPRQKTVEVSGLAENAKLFEFDSSSRNLARISQLAKPMAKATHVRVIRNSGTVHNVEYYPLKDISTVNLDNGDEIVFTADKRPATITVRVEGELISEHEYVLPYGARMGVLLTKMRLSKQADASAIQLFRESVKDRHQEMLKTSLKKLESSVLTVRAGTNEESQLRKNDAELLLQWIERAKEIEATGQVVITQADKIEDILLENGDIVNVPAVDNLVFVGGGVLFPNTFAINQEQAVEDYINMAGGYSQDEDLARIIISHRDGSFEDIDEGSWFGSLSDADIRSGDKILVLQKHDPKMRQIFKEVTQMIYQVALAAGVALRF